jgi:hypothetical protein
MARLAGAAVALPRASKLGGDESAEVPSASLVKRESVVEQHALAEQKAFRMPVRMVMLRPAGGCIR